MKRTRAGVMLCSPFDCAGVVFSGFLHQYVGKYFTTV